MGLVYRQLSLGERRELFRMLDAGLPASIMATRLGRHRSTIYREMRRNRAEEVDIDPRHRRRERVRFPGYFPVTAMTWRSVVGHGGGSCRLCGSCA